MTGFDHNLMASRIVDPPLPKGVSELAFIAGVEIVFDRPNRAWIIYHREYDQPIDQFHESWPQVGFDPSSAASHMPTTDTEYDWWTRRIARALAHVYGDPL